MKVFIPTNSMGTEPNFDDNKKKFLQVPWSSEVWLTTIENQLNETRHNEGQLDSSTDKHQWRESSKSYNKQEDKVSIFNETKEESKKLHESSEKSTEKQKDNRSQEIKESFVDKANSKRIVDANILKSLKKMTESVKGLDQDIEARILQLIEVGKRAMGVVLRDHIDGIGDITIRVIQNPVGVSIVLKGAITKLASLIETTLKSHGIKVVEIKIKEEKKKSSLKQEKEGLDALA